jgi:hypothetical protein
MAAAWQLPPGQGRSSRYGEPVINEDLARLRDEAEKKGFYGLCARVKSIETMFQAQQEQQHVVVSATWAHGHCLVRQGEAGPVARTSASEDHLADV